MTTLKDMATVKLHRESKFQRDLKANQAMNKIEMQELAISPINILQQNSTPCTPENQDKNFIDGMNFEIQQERKTGTFYNQTAQGNIENMNGSPIEIKDHVYQDQHPKLEPIN